MKMANQPWLQAPPPKWCPTEMKQAPRLNPVIPALPVRPRYALLINPFYPKDPNASFGKHVLTPTLALTSFAATTPPHWEVRYWDENLLDGPPPFSPIPEVVGITVHLTFARRAYELAQWYRQRGSKSQFDSGDGAERLYWSVCRIRIADRCAASATTAREWDSGEWLVRAGIRS